MSNQAKESNNRIFLNWLLFGSISIHSFKSIATRAPHLTIYEPLPADFDASVGDDDGDDDGDGDGDDTYRVAAKVEHPPPSSSVAGIPVLINKVLTSSTLLQLAGSYQKVVTGDS